MIYRVETNFGTDVVRTDENTLADLKRSYFKTWDEANLPLLEMKFIVEEIETITSTKFAVKLEDAISKRQG